LLVGILTITKLLDSHARIRQSLAERVLWERLLWERLLWERL
jgi:hypothetical protein